jgi:hypothetical protein
MSEKKHTLHEAMKIVLLDHPELTATTQVLSEEIASRHLYQQKKGGVAHSGQIRIRAVKYPHLFEMVDRNTVRLVESTEQKSIIPVAKVKESGIAGVPKPLQTKDRRKHNTAEFHRRRYLLAESMLFIGGLPAEYFLEENVYSFLAGVLPGDIQRLFRAGVFQETSHVTPASFTQDLVGWLESTPYPELRKILEEAGWKVSSSGNYVNIDQSVRDNFCQTHKCCYVDAWEEARGLTSKKRCQNNHSQ